MEDSQSSNGGVELAGRGTRWLLFGAGAMFVGIGTVGIVLPLLPSVVFFLLAAACFARSSPAAHRRLMANPLIGPRLRDYREHRGATVRTKVIAILMLWAGILTSVWLTGFQPWLAVPLGLIAGGVTVYLMRLRTVPVRT
ncbi:MAG: YbaN family protein [Dehalococcoidia bacterium]